MSWLLHANTQWHQTQNVATGDHRLLEFFVQVMRRAVIHMFPFHVFIYNNL